MTTAEGDNANVAIIEELKERLEFFFSDTNLRKDIWMQRELEASNDASLPLDKLLTFNSIKAISNDKALLVQAVQQLDWLELKVKDKLSTDGGDDTGDSVGRVVPFDKEKAKAFDNVPLTLYFDNLPISIEEEDNDNCVKKGYAVSVSDIKQAVMDACCNDNDKVKVTLVRLRFTHNEKHLSGEKSSSTALPLGSAFVEFETADMQKEALDRLISSGSFKIGGNEIDVKTLGQFLDDKKKGKKRPVDKVEEAEPEIDIKWEKGCVIQMEGVPDGSERESIRNALRDVLKDIEVEPEKGVYIDYSRGQKSGAIRFNSPNAKISSVVEKLLNGEIKVDGNSVEKAKLLEADEEEEYWKKFIEFKKNQLKQRKSERKSKFSKNKKRRFGGRR